MTEIQPTGLNQVQSPIYAPVGTPQSDSEQRGPESKRPLTKLDLTQPGAHDAAGENLKIARRLSDLTLSGIEAAQDSVKQIGELWRQGNITPETLRGPASRILEAAGRSYQGVQPLMQDQQLKIGEFTLQGFELVGSGGVIPMDALLPGEEAPAAINKAWPQLEEARQSALAQQQAVDRKAMESLPEMEKPSLPSINQGVHSLPPQARILELLR